MINPNNYAEDYYNSFKKRCILLNILVFHTAFRLGIMLRPGNAEKRVISEMIVKMDIANY